MRRGRDVGVDEVVVALVAHPGVPVAEVHLVVEQRQVVGAHVQHDRDHPARVDPGRGDVDVELADGDLDAADALVPDAQDALGVGGDDAGRRRRRPGRSSRNACLDVLGVIDRQVDAARAAVLVAVPLDRLADRRGVDDRQHVGLLQPVRTSWTRR